MPVVQFAPFTSLVNPGFWHELTKLKIDVLKLSDESLTIGASYSAGRSVLDRESGQEIALPCNLSVGAESFQKDHKYPHGSVPVTGTFKNFNTIEEFKEADKAKLFNEQAEKLWDNILATHDLSLLTQFLLITFADLKKYKYYYWFSFPAFAAKPAWEIDDSGWKKATEEFSPQALTSIHEQLSKLGSPPFFLLRSTPGDPAKPVVDNVDSLTEIYSPDEPITIAFVDPSASPTNPGWPLRNFLAYLRTLYPAQTQPQHPIRVLSWRDTDIPTPQGSWKSRFGVVCQPAAEAASKERPSAVGWEKNPQGKLGPRVADLAPMMDPTRLANQAVDLNLKLMRWRILPDLDLEKISSTRCLLLGAGTLGCYVARTLMAWGVRKITFVDSSRVSFSNPVRQPLFQFEDCLNGGKPKAETAASRLKEIFPGIDATGHMLSVPMPGHPVPPALVDSTKKDIKKLEDLIDGHDVIFLLMDSRESRWLPSVVGAAKGKIIINAALGFDTFLVMRHGARASLNPEKNPRLGCYYCNDIVAPADSLKDQTLDQMCTVTRPGLASIASSTAVELLASLLQHPDGIHAAPPPPPSNNAPKQGADEASESVLGIVPHQIRGFLAQFRNMPIVGAAFDKCTGCSETVVQAYEQGGAEMILRAVNEQKYLEKLTGLDKLYEEGQKALEALEWDEEAEGGSGADDF